MRALRAFFCSSSLKYPQKTVLFQHHHGLGASPVGAGDCLDCFCLVQATHEYCTIALLNFSNFGTVLNLLIMCIH